MEPRVLGYRSYNGPRWDGTVRYAIFPRQDGRRWIVYSGLNKNATSTINCAAEIITEIVDREKLLPDRVRFYDLQTQTGYHHPSYSKSGEFQFDEVKFRVIDGEIQDIQWIPQACPNFVIEVFKDLIGPNPRQSNLWAAG